RAAAGVTLPAAAPSGTSLAAASATAVGAPHAAAPPLIAPLRLALSLSATTATLAAPFPRFPCGPL
ncbi:unnamed protein product, partial [Closterium sp. NIES-54]